MCVCRLKLSTEVVIFSWSLDTESCPNIVRLNRKRLEKEFQTFLDDTLNRLFHLLEAGREHEAIRRELGHSLKVLGQRKKIETTFTESF